MKKEYNLEALNKQKEDILDKIKRLEAQLVSVDTAIKRAKDKEKLPNQNSSDKCD